MRRYTVRNSKGTAAKLPTFITVELDAAVSIAKAYFADGRGCKIQSAKGAYHLSASIIISDRELGPQQEAVLFVEYSWPQFVAPASEPRYHREIRISHTFNYQYEIEIESTDKGLLASPSFGLLPAESRHPELVIPTSRGGYVVRTRNVPPQTQLSIRMSGRARGAALPVLEELADGYKDKDLFSDVSVLFIQHLLDDFSHLVSAFWKCGLRSWDTFVVGLPYSSKQDIVQDLEYVCGRVYAPMEYENEAFKETVREALTHVFIHCRDKGGRFVVVEDGGYVARLFRERDPNVSPDWESLCVGIVEQTTNGIRVTQHWQENPELYSNALQKPVINIAETKLKLQDESPLIGRAVVFNVKRLLAGYEHSDLAGKKALVVGYGSVGREIAAVLNSEGCFVSVSENDATKTAALPATLTLVTDLSAAVPDVDLIIGCTGRGTDIPNAGDRPPFDTESIFLKMKNGVVLVNASSKKCEFNWGAIGNVTRTRIASRGFGHERELTNGAKLRIAADGFPVNFYNSQSAPAEKMQTVLGMLFVGACRLLDEQQAAGVIEFPESEQQRIVAIYKRLSR